ncbi:MAG TPA: ABC transporter ATP-binding protein [Planctomycetota bacterium]
MSAPFLTVRGVVKRFGARTALAGVELALGAGEIAVVLGATGAGKTTLLRTIAGLERPDAGTLELDGRDVTHEPPRARDVALVFQDFSLYPRWTVRANLAFPLRAPGRSLPAAEIEERVRGVAATLRIEHLLERDARRLSGGEMQRVAIGRALVRRPRLFLMDEPLTNLDAKLREALRLELVTLVRALGTPMVYVTHDQAEALSMADRIHVLDAGRVLQAGPPREVYLRPASPAVARALGSPPMNALAARREGATWVAEADGTPLCAAAAGAPARALLGVRAEHVAPAGGTHPATVEVLEDTGPHQLVVARFAGTRLHLLVGRDLELAPGRTIHPRIDPARVVTWAADGST